MARKLSVDSPRAEANQQQTARPDPFRSTSRDELLRREALRRLGRGAVDLAYDDVSAPMHVDAELDLPMGFYALRGGGRCGLFIVSCNIGGQVMSSALA